ncbi:MAG TPA: hypothetical protein VMT46_13310 [Anaerolineaceae bacterium]|nr:hypothetical protein [Anaerolineaceae bacterium]
MKWDETAGFLAARVGEILRKSVLTAVLGALVGSLFWLGVVLAVYYAFHGTPAQAQVIAAEGNLAVCSVDLPVP